MKKRWIFVLLATLMLVLTGCESVQERANTQDTWSKIAQKNQVVVGLDDSFVPMGFEKKNGQLTGYDIDLAKAVFKQYGIHVSFQTIDWSMNVTELRNGTIDLLWNGYSITPERKKKWPLVGHICATGRYWSLRRTAALIRLSRWKSMN